MVSMKVKRQRREHISMLLYTIFIDENRLSPLSHFVMARLHWAECHSECFPNMNVGVLGAKHSVYSRSILAVRFRTDVYGTAFGSSKNVCANYDMSVRKLLYVGAQIMVCCWANYYIYLR
jgi:hypothetical protein